MTGSIVFGAAIVVPMIYALLVNLPALHSPPAWDSSTTVSPAALTLVESDFDVWEVANLPGMLQGGPSTHSTSIYTIGLAVLLSWFGPATGFFVAHIVSIALIGALAAATYLLARERLSIEMSALVAIAASTLPVVLQQSSDIYLDLPLAVVTTLACWATARRRFWLTVVLVFMGVAVKTSAVFLLPLILAARPLNRPLRSHLVYAGFAGVFALLPFIPAFLTTDRFDTAIAFDGQMWLVRSSILMLVLTVDVLVVMAMFILVTYGRWRDGRSDRVSSITALLVLGFLGAYLGTLLISGTIAILPRYWIVVIPAVLVSLPPLVNPEEGRSDRRWRIVAMTGLAVLTVFSVVNRRGDFYPLPDHSFYVIAERSTRAQELLQLQIEGTRYLADTDLPVVVGNQEYFRLQYPDMGYVDETPDEVISVVDTSPTELPGSFAMLVEHRYENTLLDLAEVITAAGYTLESETFRVGGFESEVIVASR